MSQNLTETVDSIVEALASSLPAALAGAGFRAPDGWSLVGVAPRTFRATVPVVAFQRGDDTLCFIVTPTDANEPAYARTPRFDIVYFSEDVGDDEQDVVYARHRPMIDAFVKWIRAWDTPGSGEA